jgi:hypothetical protein
MKRGRLGELKKLIEPKIIGVLGRIGDREEFSCGNQKSRKDAFPEGL